MQVEDHVKVGSGAFLSYSTLPTDWRNQMMTTLGELTTCPPDEWPRDKVRKLKADESLYLLIANEELRVAFRRAKDGEITILDIFLQEVLDRYFSSNKS